MFGSFLQLWRCCLLTGLLAAGHAGLNAQQEDANAVVEEEPAEEAAVAEEVASEEKPETIKEASGEEDATDDEVVPRAFPEERYTSLWDKNPFRIETAPVIQTRENFGKDWALAGISAYKGVYTVRIQNKQTQAYQRLQEGQSGGEFRLLSVNYHKDISKSSVKVARGNETADLTYDEELRARPVTVSNTMAPAGGAGQPGQPGQPNPNQPPGAQASMMQRGPNGQPLPAGTPGLRPGMPGYVPPGRAGSVPGAVDPATGAPLPGGVPAVNPGLNPALNRAGPAFNNPGAVPTPTSRRRQLIPAPIQQKQ